MNFKQTFKQVQSRFVRKNIDKIFALLPISIFGIILFGIRALLIFAVSISSTVIFQYILNKYIEKNEEYDYLEAIVNGLFFAVLLPPTLPLYIVVIGSLFSVFVVGLFLKNNNVYIVSPAIAARIFLQISYPSQMFTFCEPMSDIIASATPLSESFYNIKEIIFGVTSGCIGETSSILILIGGIFLFASKLITWEIPLSIIATSISISLLLGQNPLLYLCSGGLLLATFFFSLDDGNIPISRYGKIVYGFGVAVITALVRTFSNINEGVSYAIVIMSLTVYLINSINFNCLRKKA